jgi:trehalose 6-phosphate phosphatase
VTADPSLDLTPSAQIAALVEPLKADPGVSAVLTDVDGTLAEIVDRADEASVPDEARALLDRLAQRYALVACVTGRRATEAREMVGVRGIVYLGIHGYERLLPGERDPISDPSLEGHEGEAAEFASHLDSAHLGALGLRIEEKGPIRAIHWRGAAHEGAAEEGAREIAVAAVGHGLVPHWGRKVLEIRPAVSIGKGSAISRILDERGIRRAFYGGDDRTDAEAFHQLRAKARAGKLDQAACVAVISPEAPEELAEEADAIVDGPTGYLEVLEILAD